MSQVSARARTLSIVACAVLSAMMMAIAPTAAEAAGIADIADPAGDNAPTDLNHLTVSWDGASLRVSATYTTATFGRLSLLIADGIDVERARRCDDSSAESLSIRATPGSGELTYGDFDQELTAPGTWQENSVTFVFVSPDLTETLSDEARLTCASGSSDGDSFFGAFAGRLLKITPANARQALRDLMVERFGRSFERSRHRWLKCPKEEIFRLTDEDWETALCQFEFRLSSSKYRAGGLLFQLIAGELVPGHVYSRTFSKKLKRCRIPDTKGGFGNGITLTDRSLHASGLLFCRGLIGSAGIANDLQSEAVGRYPRPLPRRLKLYVHGTNHAGFEEQAIFRCKVARRGLSYSAHCANALHDRLVFRFRVVPSAPKEPSNPSPSCDPNYSGCLDPNASDYDCVEGDGNGPLYTGEVRVLGDDHYDLDSDGDGIGCDGQGGGGGGGATNRHGLR